METYYSEEHIKRHEESFKKIKDRMLKEIIFLQECCKRNLMELGLKEGRQEERNNELTQILDRFKV